MLKSTGVLRRVDELGRIVIPKEIRKNLKIKNGESLVINNKANEVNGQRGNIYITVYIEPSNVFTRSGDLLKAVVLVDPIRAICGGIIDIPTPYGIKKVSLPPNTANGDKLTISGFGIKDMKKHMFGKTTNGDIEITVKYARPNLYTQSEVELLNKMGFPENWKSITKYHLN